MAKIYAFFGILVMLIGSSLGVKRYIEQNARRKDELAKRIKGDKQRKDMDDATIDDLNSADDFITKRLRDSANKRK